MSEITRRQAIGHLAAAFAAGVAVDHWLATEVHAQLRSAGATSVPKALSPQQFRTLERLTKAEVVITEPKRVTPLAFPLLVDRTRERVSSETLSDRIKRMQAALEKAAG